MFYKNVRNRRGDEGDEMVGRKGKGFRNDGHLYGHQGLNYCFIKYANPLVLLVARGGIEPPTHGFSVRCSTD